VYKRPFRPDFGHFDEIKHTSGCHTENPVQARPNFRRAGNLLVSAVFTSGGFSLKIRICHNRIFCRASEIIEAEQKRFIEEDCRHLIARHRLIIGASLILAAL